MPKPKIIDTADTMTSSKLSALKKAGPDDYTLANDLDLQFGDVPVGLGKMLLFLSAIHGFAGNPGGQLQVSKGYKESPGVFPPGLQVECSNLGRLSQMLRRYPKAQITQRATKSLSKKCRSLSKKCKSNYPQLSASLARECAT